MISIEPQPELDLDAWWQQLERLSRGLGRVGPDEVCCEGLTSRQCALLRRLAGGEGMVLGELARQAGITASALSRALDRLETAGLLERVRGQHADGRAAGVRLTPAGGQALARIDDLMRRRTRALLEAIPAPSRALVAEALRLLNRAIETVGGDVLVGECCAEPVQKCE